MGGRAVRRAGPTECEWRRGGQSPPAPAANARLHFFTVSVDDFETPPAAAVMLTVVLAVTANVVI